MITNKWLVVPVTLNVTSGSLTLSATDISFPDQEPSDTERE